MIINTTLSLHSGTKAKLNKAARLSGFSRNEIIIRLLKRIMKDAKKFYPKGT